MAGIDFKALLAVGKAGAKDAGKRAMEAGIATGIITVSVIASNQILDFKKILKAQYAKDPNNFIFKYEGAIKALGGLGAIALWGHKMPQWAKFALFGLIIQGAIKQARSFMDDQNQPLVEAIGRNSTDDEMMAAAWQVIQEVASPVNGIQNTQSGVGYNTPTLPMNWAA